MSLTYVLAGQGSHLIACAEHLLGRGHRIGNVVSDCPEVASWAQKTGTPRIEPNENLAEQLGREPFDYLFSIVNETIKLNSVIELPRLGAINFHDSLLPAYGGFNAISWAILDGNAQHGITWHRMTAEVHEGPILLQETFRISEDDTAFSLRVRSNELAVRTFPALLDLLEKDAGIAMPTLPVKDYYFKSQRPGFAVFDFAQPAASIVRLVRGMDFGSSDSWMTRAKLATPSGDFVCVGQATLLPTHNLLPGVIGNVSSDAIEAGTVSGDVRLSELSTLEDDPISGEHLVAFGLINGAALQPTNVDFTQAVEALDREVTRSERFWSSKLARFSPAHLSELKPSGPPGTIEQISVPLPKAFIGLAADSQSAQLAAALTTYLARVGEDVTRVDIGLLVEGLSNDLVALYASVVPISVETSPAATWNELVARAGLELENSLRRKTYARDIWTRYAALRGKNIAQGQFPIALAFSQFANRTIPSGVRLVVSCTPGSSELVIIFDTGAIGKLHAERFAQRLVHIIDIALQAPDVATATIPIVTAAEQELLLHTFQDTARSDIEFAGIHQLFTAQATRTPDKTALVYRDESLTYRDLNERSNALAHRLHGLGVGPDQLVAISIERSLDMVVGLLAILKAGGAYVPLDPAYPAERLSMMLEDSGAKWLLTQRHLSQQLPRHGAEVVLIDADGITSKQSNQVENAPSIEVSPENLAYLIFTSGSTGRPKGVMIEHRNVANFFAGMDERVGTEPGVWLAVTSISFDISVLEIFWTLTRGFEVVIQEEGDRASLLKSQGQTQAQPPAQITASSRPMGFGLFYFAADSSKTSSDTYRLLLDGARFADTHDFAAVWTPERHFHAFGGLYPNPAITSAAIATITSKVAIRAGSVVIPLHDPIRVAEEWAVVDNLSNGRVGLSFASGWHANDFALKPENYEPRYKVMQESIDTVLKLWAGEKIKVKNGVGAEIEISVLPRPIRERPPMWIASAGNVETFRSAGRAGHNVLTNMLGQDIKVLAANFAAYREARKQSGHEGDGIISVMLHTFVTDDDDKAREFARGPFGNYLKTSYDLVKVAPWMFPAFKQPSTAGTDNSAFDASRFDEHDMAALLDHAFDRYFDTAGLFGTPQRALRLIEQLKDIGASEVACLIDFGIDPDVVLDNLTHLDALRRLANPKVSLVPESTTPPSSGSPVSIREQFARRRITHFQCTPSMARMLIADGTIDVMGSLQKFLIGGEALPVDLAEKLVHTLPRTTLTNMYGPTETTVWSTTSNIDKNGQSVTPVTIGRPISNTQIRILDAGLSLMPVGTPGELCIGGAGVVRGYLHRPDLTAERFIPDPYQPGNRLYRTGDLARYRDDGAIEYIGRIDQQVKVNGYRIELGEIETILGRHPAVKEAVVAVKESPTGTQLVGYVIAAGDSHQADDAHAPVSDWKKRWDEAYSKRAGAGEAPVRFNTSGWLNSYTGEPIPAEQMREWLDQTVARILALKPERILEIGCGTGMILYSCLPQVDHYTAVDLSPFALETIRSELSVDERKKVTLLNQAAHELDAIDDKSCDLVILNSVAQYFPDADYLIQVLERASRVLVDGGKIFLGDIRSLEEENIFHTLVEMHKAPSQTDAKSLANRITERAALETELLLSSGFFDALEKRIARLGLVSIQIKRGRYANEMRDFRSDIVLEAGTRQPHIDESKLPLIDAPESIAVIREALASRPALLHVSDVKNARLDRVLDVASRIKNANAEATAESLRQSLDDSPSGIDPNELFDIDSEYSVELRFGSQPGFVEALYRHKKNGAAGIWAAQRADGASIANTPHKRFDADSLVPKLKAHLKDFLPEYMMPQAFVLMDAFPLTPNGKTDRKALPLPTDKPRLTAAEYVIPGNDLEKKIADIWREMLGIERVGRKDNIFDLGASSLLTVEANNRLQNILGQKIPLVTMFRYPTIETLAAHLAKTIVSDASGAMEASGTTSMQPNPAPDHDRQNRVAAAAQRRRQARAKNA